MKASQNRKFPLERGDSLREKLPLNATLAFTPHTHVLVPSCRLETFQTSVCGYLAQANVKDGESKEGKKWEEQPS